MVDSNCSVTVLVLIIFQFPQWPPARQARPNDLLKFVNNVHTKHVDGWSADDAKVKFQKMFSDHWLGHFASAILSSIYHPVLTYYLRSLLKQPSSPCSHTASAIILDSSAYRRFILLKSPSPTSQLSTLHDLAPWLFQPSESTRVSAPAWERWPQSLWQRS